jgi:hypothetical protein
MTPQIATIQPPSPYLFCKYNTKDTIRNLFEGGFISSLRLVSFACQKKKHDSLFFSFFRFCLSSFPSVCVCVMELAVLQSGPRQTLIEYDYVVEPPPALICPICFDPFVNPLELPCGHLLCLTCLSSLMKSECPECRVPFVLEKCRTPNRIIINLLEQLQVYCTYKDEGCTVQMARYPI